MDRRSPVTLKPELFSRQWRLKRLAKGAVFNWSGVLGTRRPTVSFQCEIKSRAGVI